MSQTMTIHEASKACNLSPSVLRIWELRYSWPNPKRKPNGYRAFSAIQVEELKRVSDLMKFGTPIRALIVDGLRRWPNETSPKRPIFGFIRTKSILKPRGVAEAKVQAEIIEALEKRHGRLVLELLQRAMWSVRPDDEIPSALVPSLVGLAELDRDHRGLTEAAEIRRHVLDRALQLLRRFKSATTEVWVVPTSAESYALAGLTALLLNQYGHAAQPWLRDGAPATGSVLSVGDFRVLSGRHHLGHVSSLGGDSTGLADLLTGSPLKAPPAQPSAD